MGGLCVCIPCAFRNVPHDDLPVICRLLSGALLHRRHSPKRFSGGEKRQQKRQNQASADYAFHSILFPSFHFRPTFPYVFRQSSIPSHIIRLKGSKRVISICKVSMNKMRAAKSAARVLFLLYIYIIIQYVRLYFEHSPHNPRIYRQCHPHSVQ